MIALEMHRVHVPLDVRRVGEAHLAPVVRAGVGERVHMALGDVGLKGRFVPEGGGAAGVGAGVGGLAVVDDGDVGVERGRLPTSKCTLFEGTHIRFGFFVCAFNMIFKAFSLIVALVTSLVAAVVQIFIRVVRVNVYSALVCL